MNTMIVLINIELENQRVWDMGESLGLEYLASVLIEQGYKVKIVSIPYGYDNKLLDEIIEFNPLLIGFTLPCAYTKQFAYIGNFLKKSLGNTHISCGNRYATDNSVDLLEKYWWLDSVMRGEGELTIVDLVKRLEAKTSLNGCLGVHYKEYGKVICNADRPLISDLDSLPFPVRDKVVEMDSDSQCAWISTSRGCVNNCSFCNSSFNDIQKGKVLRLRSVQNVVDEIEGIYLHIGCSKFYFVDSSYEAPGTLGKERIRGIAEEILKRQLKIEYGVFFSAHSWNEEDIELLQILKQSGMTFAYIGFESGSETGLKTLNKTANLDDNYRAIRVMRSAGIGIKSGFIMFHPFITVQEFLENNKFLFQSQLGNFLGLYITELYPYKGARIYEEIAEKGLFIQETDNELGYHKWKFADTHCSQIFQFYQSLKAEKCINKIVLPELEYKTTELIGILQNDKISSVYRESEHEITDLRAKLNQLNFELAEQVVKLIINDSTPDALQSLKTEYLKQSGPLVDLLDEKVNLLLPEIRRVMSDN